MFSFADSTNIRSLAFRTASTEPHRFLPKFRELEKLFTEGGESKLWLSSYPVDPEDRIKSFPSDQELAKLVAFEVGAHLEKGQEIPRTSDKEWETIKSMQSIDDTELLLHKLLYEATIDPLETKRHFDEIQTKRMWDDCGDLHESERYNSVILGLIDCTLHPGNSETNYSAIRQRFSWDISNPDVYEDLYFLEAQLAMILLACKVDIHAAGSNLSSLKMTDRWNKEERLFTRDMDCNEFSSALNLMHLLIEVRLSGSEDSFNADNALAKLPAIREF